MLKTTVLGCALALTLAAATSSAARPLPAGGITAAELVGILQDEGYRAKVERTSDGSPRVDSSSDGLNWSVYFYDCNANQRCGSIQFMATFDKPVSFAQVNTWNDTKRYGTGVRDNEGDAYIQMDMLVDTATTSEAVVSYLQTWSLVMVQFTRHIDFAI